MTIETSPSIENLAAALGKFQAETHGVVRDATNPFHKNRYATLEAVIETARPALAKAGLAFLQAPGDVVGGLLELSTMLMHGASGEWVRSTMSIPLAKTDPQGVGSAITYGLRYSLMAMLGLPPLDDDAEATKPQPKSHVIQALAQEQWKGEYVEGPRHKPDPTQTISTKGYDTSGKGDYIEGPKEHVKAIMENQSKQIYVENAIKRIGDMDSAPQLLEWAKTERKMVWPQYGIDPLDEDGQKLVKAYKERMAELEKSDETEAVE